MNSRNRRLLPGALLLCAAGSLLVGAAPLFAQDEDQDGPPMAPLHLEVNFSQNFQFGAPCAATIAAGDTCIDVTLSAPQTELGPLTVSRVAYFNGSSFNASTPTCLPIETQGTVTLRGGTLDIRGIGNVCLADGSASYNLVVTGGTGRYAGAIGGGEISIPPPTSNSTGRELWSVNLYLKL